MMLLMKGATTVDTAAKQGSRWQRCHGAQAVDLKNPGKQTQKLTQRAHFGAFQKIQKAYPV